MASLSRFPHAICIVSGCNEKHESLGYCQSHYARLKRHGSVQAHIPLKAKKGAAAQWIEDHKDYQGDDCLTWPFHTDRAGYAKTSIKDGAGRSKNKPVCQILCTHRHGPPPTPLHVSAHSCGKGHIACVNPRHLDWKTKKENTADMVAHGTRRQGEQIWRWVKITEAQAKEIKASNEPTDELAKRFGVTRSNINAIQAGKSWKHLKGDQ